MTSVTSGSRIAAPVMEVFASIQGEGAFVGEPQVFLRLRGCPLRCRWCDTPGSWRLDPEHEARIDARSALPAATARAPRAARREPAWATPFQAACWIAEVEPGAPRTVSVTGGEPLVWTEFLLGLKPMIGRRRLHLETAGAHPRALARVIEVCDHVSLDLKCELDLDAPVELEPAGIDTRLDGGLDGALHAPIAERAPLSSAQWHETRVACLCLVRGRDACAKIVVSGERRAECFVPLLEEIEEHAPDLTVYLQPVTPIRGVPGPARELIETVCEMARDRDLRVRVLPQVHRALGLP